MNLPNAKLVIKEADGHNRLCLESAMNVTTNAIKDKAYDDID